MTSDIEAYVVLDGGGVKGAALVGALQAANELDFQFRGYGGTSAGSIVALLSCAGYTPLELKSILVGDESLGKMTLDDRSGSDLRAIQRFKDDAWALLAPFHSSSKNKSPNLLERFLNPKKAKWVNFLRLVSQLRRLWAANSDLLEATLNSRGIYDGKQLQKWLYGLVKAKLPSITSPSFTFQELENAYKKQFKKESPTLKVVATNITYRRAQIYPTGAGDRVLESVRKSMSYPLAFKPVTEGDCLIVDGGLCSNLPVFAFNEERRLKPLPVVAIDLVFREEPPQPPDRVGMLELLNLLVESAIDGSDGIIRTEQADLFHVPVEIHPPVNTLAFDLSQNEREQLYNHGWMAFKRIVDDKKINQLRLARPESDPRLSSLYARFGLPSLIKPMLKVIHDEITKNSNAKSVRIHVMLIHRGDARIVAYQFGMEGDDDSMLELVGDIGCSGQAIRDRAVAVADLQRARTNPEIWGLTQEQADKVPNDRMFMISQPIFKLSEDQQPSEADGDLVVDSSDLSIIGTLSIDTNTPVPNNGWVKGPEDNGEYAVSKDILDILSQWSQILARQFTTFSR